MGASRGKHCQETLEKSEPLRHTSITQQFLWKTWKKRMPDTCYYVISYIRRKVLIFGIKTGVNWFIPPSCPILENPGATFLTQESYRDWKEVRELDVWCGVLIQLCNVLAKTISWATVFLTWDQIGNSFKRNTSLPTFVSLVTSWLKLHQRLFCCAHFASASQRVSKLKVSPVSSTRCFWTLPTICEFLVGRVW